MPRLYKDFTITGVENNAEFDDGIISSEAERKNVLGVLINLTGYSDNIIEITIDREKIAGVPDYLLDTDADLGAANFPISTAKMQYIELNQELALGERLQAGIRCGAVAHNVRGAYVFELMS